MNLYKYCGIDYIIDNLTKNQIFFGKPSNCNDPYEGLFKFSIPENQLDNFYKQWFDKDYNKDELNKLTSVQIEGYIVQKHKQFTDENIGICCFSEKNNSLTMWGHYADKHQGVCLEFDSDKSYFQFAKKVNYSDTIYTIEIPPNAQNLGDIFLNSGKETAYHKYLEWSYEKEWRLLNFPNSIINYESDALTGIYFGFKTPTKIIADIFSCTKHIKNLKYYRPLLSRLDYEVIFIEAKPEDLNWDTIKF